MDALTFQDAIRAAGLQPPDVIAELRRRGLDVPCERVPDFDRDGRPVKRGVYFLLSSDRRKLKRWMRERDAARCA